MIVLNNEIIKSSYSLRTKSQGEPFKRDLCVLLFLQDKKENKDLLVSGAYI